MYSADFSETSDLHDIAFENMYLDGGKLDSTQNCIVENDGRGILEKCPNMVLKLVKRSEFKHPQPNSCSCIVYKSTTRSGTLSTTGHNTAIITEVCLPASKAANIWAKRGTALLVDPLF
jgi:dynein heavy chain